VGPGADRLPKIHPVHQRIPHGALALRRERPRLFRCASTSLAKKMPDRCRGRTRPACRPGVGADQRGLVPLSRSTPSPPARRRRAAGR
jgi:hypothetical protein